MGDWIYRKADPLEDALGPMEAPAGGPAEDIMAPSDMKSLDELAQEREMAPPLIQNPTGTPTQVEPMSLKELSSLFEASSKSIQESLIDFQKADTAVSKVMSMSSTTPEDQAIVDKAQEFVSKIQNLRDAADELAESINEYRSSLSEPSGSAADWLS